MEHSPFPVRTATGAGPADLPDDGPGTAVIAGPGASPLLGVVLVTFNSAEIILDCLESLLASGGVRLRIQVVDNASTDGTADLLRAWARGDSAARAPLGDLPFALEPSAKPLPLLTDLGAAGADGHAVALLETGENLGFAGGVNRGLAELARREGIERFWILNPDTVVPPDTARAFATHPVPEGGFALMGGRVLYLDRPDMIQIDGGTINRWTGITGNLNVLHSHAVTPPPTLDRLDFITGASMVASREFYRRVGPMREDYFLYYEEVDWALRRGELPLVHCPEAVAFHRAGTAIGSPKPDRPASPFSLYFKHRARMMFLRRFRPFSLPIGWFWSLLKAAQLGAKGFRPEAGALLAGSFGRPPPGDVRQRLSPAALSRIRAGG